MLSNVSNQVEVTKMPKVTATLSGSSVSIAGTPAFSIKSYDPEAFSPMCYNVNVRVYPDGNDINTYIDTPMYVKLSGTISKANMLIFFGGLFLPYLGLNRTSVMEVHLVNSAGTKDYFHQLFAKLDSENEAPRILNYNVDVKTFIF